MAAPNCDHAYIINRAPQLHVTAPMRATHLASMLVTATLACTPPPDDGEDTDATSTATTDDSGGTVAESFGGSDSPSSLEVCDVAEPCASFDVYCDYPGCAKDFAASAPLICTWERLRDAAPTRLRIDETWDDAGINEILVVPGSGRTILFETFKFQSTTLQTCELNDPAFFQACLDDPDSDDLCYAVAHWFSDCKPLDAPTCPGA